MRTNLHLANPLNQHLPFKNLNSSKLQALPRDLQLALGTTYLWGAAALLTVLALLGSQAARGATHYVAAGTASPIAPYTNWVNAAAIIQDAIDVSAAGDEVVVTNGVYATGAGVVYGMSNRVAVSRPVVVRSVNGPEVTSIVGYQVPGTTNGPSAVRCVYLTNGAVLSGFTLTNGATQTSGDYDRQQSGGGVWCESVSAVVSNCTLSGNSAYWDGGGSYYGTLNDCTLSGNWAEWEGGGSWESTLNNCTLSGNSLYTYGLDCGSFGGGSAYGTLNNCRLSGNSADNGGGSGGGTLNNCTLSGNSASYAGGGSHSDTLNNCTLSGNWAEYEGGGSYYGTLNNCIVYYNTAPDGNHSRSTMNYCCTTPIPTNGVGNITNPPLFIDHTNGNLRLQSNSPCINAGNNAAMAVGTDMDGNLRIINGTVDIGAYEYQGDGSTISYAWLQQFGLPTDGSADALDTDGDGHTTWQEWRCATCPTNAVSALRLLSPRRDGTNMTVRWESVGGVNYCLERSTDLASPFAPIASGIPGQAGTTSYTETNAAAVAPLFYRVGVAY